MNNFTEKSRENYNKKADNYDSTFDGKFTVKFKQLLIDEIKINSGATILDVSLQKN